MAIILHGLSLTFSSKSWVWRQYPSFGLIFKRSLPLVPHHLVSELRLLIIKCDLSLSIYIIKKKIVLSVLLFYCYCVFFILLYFLCSSCWFFLCPFIFIFPLSPLLVRVFICIHSLWFHICFLCFLCHFDCSESLLSFGFRITSFGVVVAKI